MATTSCPSETNATAAASNKTTAKSAKSSPCSPKWMENFFGPLIDCMRVPRPQSVDEALGDDSYGGFNDRLDLDVFKLFKPAQAADDSAYPSLEETTASYDDDFEEDVPNLDEFVAGAKTMPQTKRDGSSNSNTAISNTNNSLALLFMVQAVLEFLKRLLWTAPSSPLVKALEQQQANKEKAQLANDNENMPIPS